MKYHDPAILPQGFSCAGKNCGIKETAPDLAVLFSAVPAAAAALFSRNRFAGAPLVVGREIIRGGRLRAVVVNSRNANVGNGEDGLRKARRMGEAAARALGVRPEEVLMSSTGVIGVPLPLEKIEAGLEGISGQLQSDPLVAATAIMTTDTHPKALSFSVGRAVVTLVAKGSGMISPNMATMLAYIMTDADLDAGYLGDVLRPVARDSFNMLSLDTDTSTSDTCVIMANGLAGPVDHSDFHQALNAGCRKMTEILARDGEGATKLLRGIVQGARCQADARIVARALINSPLIKTMAYGADPNAGRILMAVGKCVDVAVEPQRVAAWINDVKVIAGGVKIRFDEIRLRELLRGDPVDIRVDLGLGDAGATAFGCDLTHGFIDENAAYYSS